MARARGRSAGGGVLSWIVTLFSRLLVLAVFAPILAVLIYRFINPPITILMVERSIQGYGLDHRWLPIDQISPPMIRAVIASEDSGFCSHHGFDLHAMEKAMSHNEKRPGRIRGGSTISQQTAKNVFLWPERSWVRKGAEAWFTVLEELIWGKRRIMEIYLNEVELGPGVYGVESASRHYFRRSAMTLSDAEAGRLAAILPSPLKWRAVNAGPYVARRTGRIEAREGTVLRGGLDDCVLK